MKKLLLIFMALLSLFSASAATPPITSTPGNDVWYFIKSVGRQDPNAKWLTGAAAGGVLTNTLFSTTNDALLWKVVSNAGGVALVNKLYGTYMNADGLATGATVAAQISTVAVAPVTGVKFYPYVNQVVVPNGFYIVNASATEPIVDAANVTLTFSFYSAGAGSNYHPVNYGTNVPNSYSAVVFLTAKGLLLDGILTATTLLNSTSVGTNPGQYPAGSMDGLNTSIADAQSIADNLASTDAQLLTALTNLNAIVDLFKSSVILPQLDVWYFIQGTRPATTFLTAPAAAAGTQVKNLAVIPDDTQLWKFVTNGDGFAIQNKASLEYLVTDVASNTNLPTQVAMPTKALRCIISNETSNKTSRFWIENTVSGAAQPFRLHAGGTPGFGLMNYTGNAADNCTWQLIDNSASQKIILAAKIADAQLLLSSRISGTEPGQYDAQELANLQATVVYVQGIYDAPASTSVDYVDAMAQLALVSAAAEATLVLPTKSGVGNDVWYYLKSVYPANTYLSAGGTGSTTVRVDPFANTDNQLWKLVPNGTGFGLVNKATGQYANSDTPFLYMLGTVAVAPVNQLRTMVYPISATTGGTPKTVAFGIENIVGSLPDFCLHASTTYAGLVSNYYKSTTDLWQFITPTAIYKQNFIDMLAAAQARITLNPVQGAEFGQVTTAAYTALQTTIATQSALNIATMTQADFIAGATALNNATVAFVPNTNLKSTDPLTSNKWFRIISTSPNAYAQGMAISSNGRTEGAKFTFETRNVNSDAQLFRFELSSDSATVVGIVNKATGKYMGVDGTVLAAPTTNNAFKFVALTDVFSFNIQPTLPDPASTAVPQVAYLPLNALNVGTAIGNYAGGAGTGSAWRFEFVNNEAIADYTPLYLQARQTARTNVTAVTPLAGTEFGQYTAASFTSFNNLVTAEEAKTPATMTQAELLTGLLALLNAPSALSVNTDISLLGSSAASPKWFRLINAAQATYAAGMAMSSTARVEGAKFTYEPKNVAATVQLFRFDLNATQTNVLNIVNYFGATADVVEYVAADGTVQSASTLDNEFQVTQLGATNSFWIRPTALSTDLIPVQLSPLHAAETGADIVNYLDGAGSASAWRFEYVGSGLNALKNVSAARYQIASNHGVITVKGVENFEVYSVLGQQQNTKVALKSGVYFVKVNNYTQKYILK